MEAEQGRLVDDEVIKYEQWPPRASAGGQVVGPGPSGVRGVHWQHGYPSGVEACCSLHRSQHKNKKAVDEMIQWALSTR